MKKRNSRRRSAGFFAAVLLVAILLTGCPDPFSLDDDVTRDLDRPLAQDIAVDPQESGSEYETLPTWTWTGDPSEQPYIFRYRINGSDWDVYVPDPIEEPPFEYTPANDLYPGTYLFEVQQRNAAGNWSESVESVTVILVRPPPEGGLQMVGDNGPFTNDPSPSFQWDPSEMQYGALTSFSVRLERLVASQWETVVTDRVDDTDFGATPSYTVLEPLSDGPYRFGVAQWNEGGNRSAFVYLQFAVDTVPPNAPIHTTADRIVSNTRPTWTWATGGPDGNGTYRWWLRSDGSVPDPGQDESTGGPVAASEYTPTVDLAEGEHVLYVQERDAAGNWSEFGVFLIAIDFSIPDFSVLGATVEPPETTEYYFGATAGPVTIEYITSGVDQVEDVFQYSLDDGASWSADFVPELPDQPQQLALGDGTYFIRVRQRRIDDSYTVPSPMKTVVVDTVPPGSPSVSGPGFGGSPVTTFLPSVEITVSDSSGDAAVMFDVRVEDGGGNLILNLENVAPGPVTVELGTGDRYVAVTARDRALNESEETRSERITVLLNGAPAVTSAETPTLNRRPEWTWTAIEELTTAFFRHSFDEISWTTTSGESYIPDEDLATGFHTLYVQQQDDLGEWSESGSYQVEVLGTGSVTVTITLEDPAEPTFTLPSLEEPVIQGDLLTVNLQSTIEFDDVTWLVNGEIVNGDLFTPPATETSLTDLDTAGLPLGINRIAVLVEIDGAMYSSEDMTFEVVQP